MKLWKLWALTVFLIGLNSTSIPHSMADEGVRVSIDTNGMLKGYIVEKGEKVICRNPLVWNQFRGPESYIVCDSESGPPSEHVTANATGNGVLKGYIVQKDGKEICRDPTVWVRFRSTKSYIVCD